ncbi:hypothetical protein NKJ59_02630 [Mesorhizobium australicum]|uniref:hypothetical protein n=1 Tax=Mesorhizobium australicum TaxID=536018 RepID=UPI003336A881
MIGSKFIGSTGSAVLNLGMYDDLVGSNGIETKKLPHESQQDTGLVRATAVAAPSQEGTYIVGATTSVMISKPAWHEVASSSMSLQRPNSDRARKFVRLIQTIRKMAKLPEGDDFSLDPVIAQRTESLLGLLCYNMDETDAPRIYPHERDAVLTWESNFTKQYLTFDRDEIDHTIINKATMVRCSEAVQCHGPEDLYNWLIKFGGVVKPDSNVEKADAL